MLRQKIRELASSYIFVSKIRQFSLSEKQLFRKNPVQKLIQRGGLPAVSPDGILLILHEENGITADD